MDVSVIILDLCDCMKYRCEYYYVTLDVYGCMMYGCEYRCIKCGCIGYGYVLYIVYIIRSMCYG